MTHDQVRVAKGRLRGDHVDLRVAHSLHAGLGGIVGNNRNVAWIANRELHAYQVQGRNHTFSRRGVVMGVDTDDVVTVVGDQP